jgi:hypothetical protein
MNFSGAPAVSLVSQCEGNVADDLEQSRAATGNIVPLQEVLGVISMARCMRSGFGKRLGRELDEPDAYLFVFEFWAHPEMVSGLKHATQSPMSIRGSERKTLSHG